MKIYKYRAADTTKIFGEHDPLEMEPSIVGPKVISLAQRPDYSEYLVLSDETHEFFELFDGNFDGWDFNYCQEWGLTVNDDVVERVMKEVRRKMLSEIVVKTTAGNMFDGNDQARLNLISAISAIGENTVSWKMADNSIVSGICKGELEEALRLSIQEVGNILFNVTYERE